MLFLRTQLAWNVPIHSQPHSIKFYSARLVHLFFSSQNEYQKNAWGTKQEPFSQRQISALLFNMFYQGALIWTWFGILDVRGERIHSPHPAVNPWGKPRVRNKSILCTPFPTEPRKRGPATLSALLALETSHTCVPFTPTWASLCNGTYAGCHLKVDFKQTRSPSPFWVPLGQSRDLLILENMNYLS